MDFEQLICCRRRHQSTSTLSGHRIVRPSTTGWQPALMHLWVSYARQALLPAARFCQQAQPGMCAGDKRNQLINLLERVGRRGPDQAALREQAAASSSAGSDALRASMPPSDQPLVCTNLVADTHQSATAINKPQEACSVTCGPAACSTSSRHGSPGTETLVFVQRGSTRKSDADIENAFLDVEREMLEKLIKSGSTSRCSPDPELPPLSTPGSMCLVRYTARKRRPGMLRRDTESTKTSTPDTPKPQPADWPSTSYQPSSMPQPHRPPDRDLPPREQRPQPSQPAMRSQPTDLQGSAGLPQWWPAGEREWRDELQSPDQQSISSTVQRVCFEISNSDMCMCPS